MAEKSTRINDQSAGEYIATREAAAQDDEAHDRNVQLMDWATRRHGWTISSKLRAGITSTDSEDFTSGVPSAITTNKLTVGDGQLLIATVIVQLSADTKIMITPIVLDASNNAIALLTPKIYQGLTPPNGGGGSFRITDTVQKHLTPVQAWDVMGCDNIGIHVDIGSATSVDLFAKIISGMPDQNVAYTWPQQSFIWDFSLGAP